jgi:CDGSH-type Zn-finger protein
VRGGFGDLRRTKTIDILELQHQLQFQIEGAAMADVTIRMRPNGPLVIEGPFKLIDSRGAEFEIPANKPAIALCRCGQSSKRPFCDGSHKTCGFVSDEAPTPPAVG